MSWYGASGVCAIFAATSFGAAAEHGHVICADEFAIGLTAQFILFAVASPTCLVIGIIRSWTALR
jgi:NhaP-type Na+/H+ or K+/H+ antiporter